MTIPFAALPTMQRILMLMLWLAAMFYAPQAQASIYDAELPEQLLHGADLCALAPCRENR